MKPVNIKIIAAVFGIAAAIPCFAQNVSFPGPLSSSGNAVFIHPWAGAKVAYLGDSISDPNNDGSDLKYWDYLREWLGITPYVYAISGRQWNDVPRQAAKLHAEHGDDVDAIIVFMGTNDYSYGTPLGEWFEERQDTVTAGLGKAIPPMRYKRMHRRPSMDPGTYRGRINMAMDTLRKLYPTKQIVLLTPLHRSLFNVAKTNNQPDENYANFSGLYLEPYIEDIRTAGDIWSAPVIDLHAISGIYPSSDGSGKAYMHKSNDLLHPNDAGHRRIALTLYYQLLTLPCRFE